MVCNVVLCDYPWYYMDNKCGLFKASSCFLEEITSIKLKFGIAFIKKLKTLVTK